MGEEEQEEEVAKEVNKVEQDAGPEVTDKKEDYDHIDHPPTTQREINGWYVFEVAVSAFICKC